MSGQNQTFQSYVLPLLLFMFMFRFLSHNCPHGILRQKYLHQVAAADAPKVRGIYARFPRLREAVNDKILTNTVLVRVQLEVAKA